MATGGGDPPKETEEDGVSLGGSHRSQSPDGILTDAEFKRLKAARSNLKRKMTLHIAGFEKFLQKAAIDRTDLVEGSYRLLEDVYHQLVEVNDKLVEDLDARTQDGQPNEHADYGAEEFDRFNTATLQMCDFVHRAKRYQEEQTQHMRELSGEREERERASRPAAATGAELYEGIATAVARAVSDTSGTAEFSDKLGKIFGQNYVVSIKPPFDGSANSNYTSFITQWTSAEKVLDGIGKSNSEKLLELKKVLKGEALTLIDSLPESNANYQSALDHLKEMYGDVLSLVRSTVNTFMDSKPGSTKEDLRRVYGVLWSTLTTLRGLNMNSDELSFVLYVSMAERLLPGHVKSEWFKICRKKKDDKKATGTTAGEDDFFQIIRDQIAKDQTTPEKKKDPTEQTLALFRMG